MKPLASLRPGLTLNSYYLLLVFLCFAVLGMRCSADDFNNPENQITTTNNVLTKIEALRSEFDKIKAKWRDLVIRVGHEETMGCSQDELTIHDDTKTLEKISIHYPECGFISYDFLSRFYAAWEVLKQSINEADIKLAQAISQIEKSFDEMRTKTEFESSNDYDVRISKQLVSTSNNIVGVNQAIDRIDKMVSEGIGVLSNSPERDRRFNKAYVAAKMRMEPYDPEKQCFSLTPVCSVGFMHSSKKGNNDWCSMSIYSRSSIVIVPCPPDIAKQVRVISDSQNLFVVIEADNPGFTMKTRQKFIPMPSIEKKEVDAFQTLAYLSGASHDSPDFLNRGERTKILPIFDYRLESWDKIKKCDIYNNKGDLIYSSSY